MQIVCASEMTGRDFGWCTYNLGKLYNAAIPSGRGQGCFATFAILGKVCRRLQIDMESF